MMTLDSVNNLESNRVGASMELAGNEAEDAADRASADAGRVNGTGSIEEASHDFAMECDQVMSSSATESRPGADGEASDMGNTSVGKPLIDNSSPDDLPLIVEEKEPIGGQKDDYIEPTRENLIHHNHEHLQTNGNSCLEASAGQHMAPLAASWPPCNGAPSNDGSMIINATEYNHLNEPLIVTADNEADRQHYHHNHSHDHHHHNHPHHPHHLHHQHLHQPQHQDQHQHHVEYNNNTNEHSQLFYTQPNDLGPHHVQHAHHHHHHHHQHAQNHYQHHFDSILSPANHQTEQFNGNNSQVTLASYNQQPFETGTAPYDHRQHMHHMIQQQHHHQHNQADVYWSSSDASMYDHHQASSSYNVLSTSQQQQQQQHYHFNYQNEHQHQHQSAALFAHNNEYAQLAATKTTLPNGGLPETVVALNNPHRSNLSQDLLLLQNEEQGQARMVVDNEQQQQQQAQVNHIWPTAGEDGENQENTNLLALQNCCSSSAAQLLATSDHDSKQQQQQQDSLGSERTVIRRQNKPENHDLLVMNEQLASGKQQQTTKEVKRRGSIRKIRKSSSGPLQLDNCATIVNLDEHDNDKSAATRCPSSPSASSSVSSSSSRSAASSSCSSSTRAHSSSICSSQQATTNSNAGSITPSQSTTTTTTFRHCDWTIVSDSSTGCIIVNHSLPPTTLCGATFNQLDSFVAHLEEEHVKQDPVKKGHYFCRWSGCKRTESFNARYKLLVHMRVHSGEKPFECTSSADCKKRFSRLENLKIHVRSHTGEKPYSCNYPNCSKSFTNSSDRIKHHKTHDNPKPYPCSEKGCEKRYTDPSSLRKHQKSHRRDLNGATLNQSGQDQHQQQAPEQVPSLHDTHHRQHNNNLTNQDQVLFELEQQPANVHYANYDQATLSGCYEQQNRIGHQDFDCPADFDPNFILQEHHNSNTNQLDPSGQTSASYPEPSSCSNYAADQQHGPMLMSSTDNDTYEQRNQLDKLNSQLSQTWAGPRTSHQAAFQSQWTSNWHDHDNYHHQAAGTNQQTHTHTQTYTAAGGQQTSAATAFDGAPSSSLEVREEKREMGAAGSCLPMEQDNNQLMHQQYADEQYNSSYDQQHHRPNQINTSEGDNLTQQRHQLPFANQLEHQHQHQNEATSMLHQQLMRSLPPSNSNHRPNYQQQAASRHSAENNHHAIMAGYQQEQHHQQQHQEHMASAAYGTATTISMNSNSNLDPSPANRMHVS